MGVVSSLPQTEAFRDGAFVRGVSILLVVVFAYLYMVR